MTNPSYRLIILLLALPLALGARLPGKPAKGVSAGIQEAAKNTASTPTQPTASRSSSPVIPITPKGTRGDSAVAAATPTYSITWSSINGGGLTNMTSASFSMGSSAAQSMAGSAASSSYKSGIGFWYGVGGCNCPKQGDINGDGILDVFDVIGLIDIAFGGATDPEDANCPKTRGDVDNNGVTDVFDVIYLIATAFSGGPDPVDPCTL